MRTPTRARALVATTVAAAVLAGCGDGSRDAITTPASGEAAAIAWLWWFALGLGIVVYLAVMALLVVPLLRSRRRRRGGGEPTPPRSGGGVRPAPAASIDEPPPTADPALADEAERDAAPRSRMLWWGGIILPAIILTTLLVSSAIVGTRTAHVATDGELVIDVRGHMFWWEVSYPDLGIVTANEIAVPVDQPVRLRLTTEDVIHSFWIPRLHGKIDMIPGQENWLSFTATETGSFRGNCAEFCGIAHAQMIAFVDAMEPDDFDTWVDEHQQDPPPASETGTEVGERLFLQVGCADCHAVSGTAAVGGVGPDLSHLAARQRLAGGIVPNTADNLARLITDPWGLKPGNPMPPTQLSEDELDELIGYLQTLETTGGGS